MTKTTIAGGAFAAVIVLQFEHNGDLGKGNAGLLIFVDGRERPEYVLWSDVEQISLDRPPRMYPPQK